MAERETWPESFRALGTSVLELVRAEAAAAVKDFKVFIRQVAVLLGIGAGLLLLVVYLPFILLITAVDALRSLTGWPVWGSALLLFVLVLLFMGLIGAVAYALVIRRMEPPTAAFARRLDDHRGWWRNEVLVEPRRLDDKADLEPERSGP